MTHLHDYMQLQFSEYALPILLKQHSSSLLVNVNFLLFKDRLFVKDLRQHTNYISFSHFCLQTRHKKT